MWEQMNFQGFAGFRIIKKLQSLNSRIKAWNGQVFGNIKSSRNSVSKQLDDCDLKEEVRGLNHDEREARGWLSRDYGILIEWRR